MTDLADGFDWLLRGFDVPAYEREYRFAPPRRWRFDFSWRLYMVAIEVDGGQWMMGGGRHNGDADREKLNEAAVLGWRVLHFSSNMLRTDPLGCVTTLRRALGITGDVEVYQQHEEDKR